jgi:hypothetical protein
MKWKFFIVGVIAIFFVSAMPPAQALQASKLKQERPETQPDAFQLHDEEFRFLVNYLQRTNDMMHDYVRGVSAEQWTFKAKPFRWSVAECAEHIILAEQWLMNEFEQKFAKGNEPAYIFHWRKPKPKPEEFSIIPMSERWLTDLRVLNDNLDRSKVDTSIPGSPPPEVKLVPQMKYKTPQEMLADFDNLRRNTLRIITEHKAELRKYYIYPGTSFFLFDGYQYLLRIPAHCERHLMQLQEVKRDPNYPK